MSLKNVTISAARQALFDLFAAVTSHRGRKVVITSRGTDAHAVLVEESYLNSLEAAAKRLEAIESGKAKPAPQFKLIGSMQLAKSWPSQDSIAVLRSAAEAKWQKKLSSF
jgi:PHD/YefM family antitoxin component YafN of YafNO toxin-antitoxin module